MPVPIRILIYGRGTPAEVIDQHALCNATAGMLGNHHVVSLASDPPGGSAGWESAIAMVAAGEVDRILVATRDVIPIMSVVDSVTRGIEPQFVRQAQGQSRHRTRPIDRGDGAA